MRTTRLFAWVLLLATLSLSGCAGGTPAPAATSPASPPAIANPASENCLKQGGTLEIRKRGDGGEYGVCLFEDNRQCEEWALLRGDCPVGGRKVTGYVTEAAQYCAITGGEYAVTGNSNTDNEQGTCTLKDGQVCDAREYYQGKCPAPAGQASYADPFAYCAAVGAADVPAAPYDGPAMPEAIVQAMVRQGIIASDAPAAIQQNAVWRCMNSQVWACHRGANLPCEEKADTSEVASAGMSEFCKANPAASVIPAAVTGRATVYEWKCADGQPRVAKQVFQSDPQGYLADFWQELAPQ